MFNMEVNSKRKFYVLIKTDRNVYYSLYTWGSDNDYVVHL